jgi:quercetin dioxygenase-like cupin family protein
VRLHAIGGEQVLLCRVTYEPGTGIPRHSHTECEQIVAVVEGDVTVSVAGQSRRLEAGDVAVIRRGQEHELRSEGGCTFFEALTPVPLDHVPDRERDLVLGEDGGRAHVER